MRDTVRLGRVGGVAVGVHWSLAGVVVLLGYGLARDRLPGDAPGLGHVDYAVAGTATALGLVVGVLVHEAGHAVVGRWAGMGVDGITLSWMGGVTRLESESPSPWWEVVVAAVGPLASAALGGALLGVAAALGPAPPGGTVSLVLASLRWLGVIQLALAVGNLVPAAPLDGGRVLHGLVWRACGDRWRASRAASSIGVGFGAVVLGAGLVGLGRGRDPLDSILLGVLGWWLVTAARNEARLAGVSQALDGVSVAEVMRPVASSPGWIGVEEFLASYDAPRPGWVWLLEAWGGGFSGVVTGEAARAALAGGRTPGRVADVALPVAGVPGAAPGEGVLACMARTGGSTVVLVVDAGHTLGAVLPADVEARATGYAGGTPRG